MYTDSSTATLVMFAVRLDSHDGEVAYTIPQLIAIQMASLHPLFIVTAVVLLCGALTGEEGLYKCAILPCTQ